jgi:phosphoenolpyruvate carboxylase
MDRALVLARTFGLHMAALDVRQHSRVFEEAVAALLAAGGVTAEYANLDEGLAANCSRGAAQPAPAAAAGRIAW